MECPIMCIEGQRLRQMQAREVNMLGIISMLGAIEMRSFAKVPLQF